MFQKPALLVLLAAAGCMHTPPPVVIDTATPIVLPEKVGGKVNEVLLEISNTDVGAVTLPGLPPVFLKGYAADDPCLVAHEEEHVRQQKADGAVRWSARYVHELIRCLAPVPAAQRRAEYYRCYANISYEKQAFKVQKACAEPAATVSL